MPSDTRNNNTHNGGEREYKFSYTLMGGLHELSTTLILTGLSIWLEDRVSRRWIPVSWFRYPSRTYSVDEHTDFRTYKEGPRVNDALFVFDDHN